MTNILQAVDQGDVVIIVLLDLAAVFDNVGHNILIQRLDWAASRLTGSDHSRPAALSTFDLEQITPPL